MNTLKKIYKTGELELIKNYKIQELDKIKARIVVRAFILQ